MQFKTLGEMKGEVEQKVGDLHAGLADYGSMDNSDGSSVNEREAWFHSDQQEFLAVNDDASMFFPDFPPLSDFPCMSSPTSLPSSSSTPAPAKTTTCSPSSDSWSVLKSDPEEDAEKIKQLHDPVYASMEIPQPTDSSSLGGDFMETFGFNNNLSETLDFFDSIFQTHEIEKENSLEVFTQVEQQHAVVVQHQPPPQQEAEDDEFAQEEQHAVVVQHQPPPQQEAENYDFTQEEQQHAVVVQHQPPPPQEAKDDELTRVFTEWLRTNKDRVSADGLRSVKLNEATIEAAARGLGRSKEGMKQLLKLVLEWVQKCHLQNKRRNIKNTPLNNVLNQYQNPTENHNTNTASNLSPSSFGPELNPCFNYSSWIPPPTFGAGPSVFSAPFVGYVGDPYRIGFSNNTNSTHNNAHSAANMLKSAYPLPHSHFTGTSHYNHGPGGDRLMRLGSLASKEARKKRMAKYLSHHRRHNQHCQKQNQDHLSQTDADPIVMGSGNCTAGVKGNTSLCKGALVIPAMAEEPVAKKLVMDQKAIQIQTPNYFHQGHASSDGQQMKVRQAGKKQETKKAGKLQKNQHANDGATSAGTSANK